MTSRVAQFLRNHLHVLIIVPLVVIATTWPTFPRIFDADEFWLPTRDKDTWLKFWDAWHFGRVIAGQADYYYADSIFHPHGISLAFHQISQPHALLFHALQYAMPSDDAYSLLFLLILCFNAFCCYLLALHLIKDKWIAMFGAIVVIGAIMPFPHHATLPDLITIGTLPLTIYFYHRSVLENRRLFAALAGVCAGATAFIGMYIFVFILISVGIYALYLAMSRWNQSAFWLGLLLFAAACVSCSATRLYPMVADPALYQERQQEHFSNLRSNDVLDFFVLTRNPFTGDALRNLFGVPHESQHYSGYLGYINLILLAAAFLLARRRQKLLPWLTMFSLFAILRLGDFLTVNDIKYYDVLLPGKLLSDSLPQLFGHVAIQEFYQFGVIVPLAVLACFGLEILLRSKPSRIRIAAALLFALIVIFEFCAPLQGWHIERSRTAFFNWLRSEPKSQIKLVHLPHSGPNPAYFLYLQTLEDYPLVYGQANFVPASVKARINDNLLLSRWNEARNIHCLPHEKRAFSAALDQLLADGVSHIVVHNWLFGDHFIIHSFRNIPPAYDDGSVSIYRVSDLRLSCHNQGAELPRFTQLANSSLATPGSGSAILSIHPDKPIDANLFDYLGSLFSDWRSLVHLYQADGELAMQNAGAPYPDLDAFTEDNQVIHFLYNTRDARPDRLISEDSFEEFNLCQREAKDDGAAVEHYVSRDFACELVTSDSPFEVRYANGARLDNLIVQAEQDVVDLQFMWRDLPDEPYSVSIQVFDATGEKVLGQDSVIGHVTLARHRIDLSSLPPGDYNVKLIMYNFESGAVVSGAVSNNDARFDRALVVAAIHRP